MTEDEWLKFITTGAPSVVSVARLEPGLCTRIGASTNLVQMRHDYALKILQHHSVLPHHFRLLTWAIESGSAFQDRASHLTFFRLDKYAGWFHATIKRNAAGTEIWVATFHKTEQRHVHRAHKRYKLIREHE